MTLGFLCSILYFIKACSSANEYISTNNHYATVAAQQTISSLKHQQIAVPKIYKKEFYLFTAPEDEFIQAEALKNLLPSLRKRQQIIFIKSPEGNAYDKAIQNLIQKTQRTHIYIFNKEPSYPDLQQKFETLQKTIHHKPEVYFIKYYNPSQAQNIMSPITQQHGGGNNYKITQFRSVVKDSSPLSKNYAMNFLPNGVDVVPGSSYIPLV